MVDSVHSLRQIGWPVRREVETKFRTSKILPLTRMVPADVRKSDILLGGGKSDVDDKTSVGVGAVGSEELNCLRNIPEVSGVATEKGVTTTITGVGRE